MSEPLDRIEVALNDVAHSSDCEWHRGMCTCGYVKICAAVEEFRQELQDIQAYTSSMEGEGYRSWKAERDQLRAQVAEMAEALRPFADFHGRMVDGPDYSYMDDRIKDWLGVSDFKAAAAALAKVEAPRCDVPPSGWRCTREAGHDGPCAAVPRAE